MHVFLFCCGRCTWQNKLESLLVEPHKPSYSAMKVPLNLATQKPCKSAKVLSLVSVTRVSSTWSCTKLKLLACVNLYKLWSYLEICSTHQKITLETSCTWHTHVVMHVHRIMTWLKTTKCFHTYNMLDCRHTKLILFPTHNLATCSHIGKRSKNTLRTGSCWACNAIC